ncbi:hypothetical protein QQ045_002078 [Rhodiola kirilowii]
MACRDLPITAIVHFTFKQAHALFIKRRDALLDHNKYFVFKIESKIHANLVKSTQCKVQMFDRSKGIASFLTKSKEHKHIVSMEDMTCGCGKWQLFHYPCCHVLAVCEEEGISIRDCMATEYSMQACNDTWSCTFNPQPDITQWKEYDGPKHIPNKLFKQTKRGRHPTKRRRNEMDARRDPRPSHVEASIEQASTRLKRVYKCSICGVVGHTKNLALHLVW